MLSMDRKYIMNIVNFNSNVDLQLLVKYVYLSEEIALQFKVKFSKDWCNKFLELLDKFVKKAK